MSVCVRERERECVCVCVCVHVCWHTCTCVCTCVHVACMCLKSMRRCVFRRLRHKTTKHNGMRSLCIQGHARQGTRLGSKRPLCLYWKQYLSKTGWPREHSTNIAAFRCHEKNARCMDKPPTSAASGCQNHPRAKVAVQRPPFSEGSLSR
jgi:hypothetical protein